MIFTFLLRITACLALITVPMWILQGCNAGVSGDHLLTATRKLLHESRFVIPGTRRLSNLMQAAVSSVPRLIIAASEHMGSSAGLSDGRRRRRNHSGHVG